MESLVKLLMKMYDKNPILFNVVKYASVLDPKFLVSEPLDVCKSLFQMLLFTLINLKIVYSSQADLALSEFSSFYNASLREEETSFESCQKECDRLDDFCQGNKYVQLQNSFIYFQACIGVKS